MRKLFKSEEADRLWLSLVFYECYCNILSSPSFGNSLKFIHNRGLVDVT